ncbi:MAG: hypothetical protein HY903_11990 [Deltaproteobacteria bacterium]|nr:hypothetical protein [Deltaproteobacteria bacterium]
MNLRLASLLVLVTPGCSGLLVIQEPRHAVPCTSSSECGIDWVCDTTLGECVPSPGPCSKDQPDGDCARGRLCAGGVCFCVDAAACCAATGCKEPNPDWCVCPPDQGCDADGKCTTDPSTACSPARPDGWCDHGEVCIGGHCVPNRYPCSPEHPGGWCDPGLTCFEGRCIPIDTPCSRANPAGQCPSGQACDATSGTCKTIQCRPGIPGACPEDQVCEATGCVPLPCSQDHPTGACPDGQYCSDAWICVIIGKCGADTDCDPNQYCDTALTCRATGQCAVDEDCSVEQAVEYGQGYACPAGTCSERLTCTMPTDCKPGKFCSTAGNCLAPPGCDTTPDCPTGTTPPKVCSTAGICIDENTCLVRADCPDPVGEICSATSECITAGTCNLDADCAPGHSCNAPDCVVSGTLCVTNDLKYTGCNATEYSCCDSASSTDCCPLGQRCFYDAGCSTPGTCSCITPLTCVTAADCPTGTFTCDDSHHCVTSEACATTGCGATGKCSATGACLPAGGCATAADCAVGETCNVQWQCEPVPECTMARLSAGDLAPPNILVALDRSASMQICGAGESLAGCCGYSCSDPTITITCADANSGRAPYCIAGVPSCSTTGTPRCSDGTVGCSGGGSPTCTGASAPFTLECPGSQTAICTSQTPDCNTGGHGETTSRWEQAVQAVTDVIADQAGNANFGLALFPHPTGTETCVTDCNWYSCSDRSNNNAGAIDVRVAANQQAAIGAALVPTMPGGGTPTGQTLRAIGADLFAAGLDDPATQNAVLLVTDGEAIGDVDPATQKVCRPPCTDTTKNGDESDVDCGGTCAPCIDGGLCLTANDCEHNICRTGMCRAATCGDAGQNGSETDVDCGGACGPCADGASCTTGADCASGNCQLLRCLVPACGDGIKNGSETDVDCGGSSCAANCADTKGCADDADCTSSACQAGICRIGTCNNGGKDGLETDADCGGSACGPCVDGKTCTADGDCTSAFCNGAPAGVCATPQCKDGLLNGSETDVDCGGSCPACGGGKTCALPGDCVSATCAPCDTSCSSNDCNSGTCTNAACPMCDGGVGNCQAQACRDCIATQYACKVNHALDQLYAGTPRIKTYVVAFNFTATSGNLNCHAVHGRTSAGLCPGLTDANCAASASTCYYDTQQLDELKAALAAIVKQVRGCSLPLGPLPVRADIDKIYLYLETPNASGPPTLQRVDRWVNWIYDPGGNRIDVFGAPCETLKEGGVVPVVVYGCAVVPG